MLLKRVSSILVIYLADHYDVCVFSDDEELFKERDFVKFNLIIDTDDDMPESNTMIFISLDNEEILKTGEFDAKIESKIKSLQKKV